MTRHLALLHCERWVDEFHTSQSIACHMPQLARYTYSKSISQPPIALSRPRCDICEAGTFSNTSSNSCTTCPAGRYSNDTAPECGSILRRPKAKGVRLMYWGMSGSRAPGLCGFRYCLIARVPTKSMLAKMYSPAEVFGIGKGD